MSSEKEETPPMQKKLKGKKRSEKTMDKEKVKEKKKRKRKFCRFVQNRKIVVTAFNFYKAAKFYTMQ